MPPIVPMPAKPSTGQPWTDVGDAWYANVSQLITDVPRLKSDVLALQGTLANLQATRAPLASPTFTGTVSGVTKAMVGLSQADNTSDAAKQLDAANMYGVLASARLPVEVPGFRVRTPANEAAPTATNWGPRPVGYQVVVAIGAPPAPADQLGSDLHVATAGTGTVGENPTDPVDPPVDPEDPGTTPMEPGWATSVGLASTGWREIALRLTSTAENSTTAWTTKYGYIEDIGDGRGYTAGIVGFCSGTGDMLALVEYANTAYPSNSLAKWLPQLRQIMAASYSQRPALSNSLLGSAFKTDWANASAQAWFQDCQRRERDRVYWGPALAAAQEDGVGLLGLCILYDISVNHGPGTDAESFGGIVANARAAAKPPSKGGSESAYLAKLTDLRNTVLKGWGDIQDGNGRVYMHRQLLANNPGMTLPISWTCYGDPFSITSMPTEGGLAAVDLTDEADIIVAADSSNFDGAALVGTINSNSISTATRDDYVIRFPGAQWLAGFRQMARNVCSILYNKQSEVPRTHAIVKLTFTANDMLAAATASTGGIEFGNQSRGAAVTASYTTHEVVHLFQYGGSYGTSPQATGVIEGIADLVLIRLGYHPAQSRRPAGGGSSWYDGYDTTGFFLDWIERYAPTPSPGFARKLNAAMAASTFNPAVITSLNARGKTVDALWTEYKAWVAALPPYANPH